MKASIVWKPFFVLSVYLQKFSYSLRKIPYSYPFLLFIFALC